MEHEFEPKVEPFDFDRPEGHDGPGFTRVIQVELESFGKPRDPAHVVKQIQYQVEDMIRHMRLKYAAIYGETLDIEVAWVKEE